MLALVLRNLLRRPLRNGLTLAGIAVAMAVLVCIVAFGDGYRRALRGELILLSVRSANATTLIAVFGCPDTPPFPVREIPLNSYSKQRINWPS